MRVIEVNSYEELEAAEKEVLGLGFRYDTICEVRKCIFYYKLGHEIRIKCNFWP